VLSIHERNGFILTGADTAIRVFSFWLMFAPIAQYYALDALRRREPPSPAFALPARILQLQLVIIYFVTFYLKLLEPIWLEGKALFYVLQLDSILLPPGALLRQTPHWLQVGLTHYTLVAEIAIPLLLLFPLRRWFVGLAFALAVMLHGGIGLALAIPDFSLVMLIAFFAHFPPQWFDRLDKQLQHLRSHPRLQCLLEWSIKRTPPPPTAPKWHRKALSLLLIPLMILVLWWNVVEVSRYADDYGYRALPPMPMVLEDIVWYSGLWQWWDLFAPLPIQYDGYIVIPGQFENGITYDLRTHEPAPGQELFSRFGPIMRFEKLEENVVRYEDAPLLRAWGNYYCRVYNDERPAIRGTRLATLEIQFIYRNSHTPGEEANPYQMDLLWQHWCHEEFAPQE
jgi:hypothetical protein